MRSIGLAGALALGVFATAAQAAPCETRGSPGAQAIQLPTGDPQQDIAWAVILMPAVSDDALSPEGLAAAEGCQRTGFVVDKAHYQLTGEAADHFPRVARRADGEGAAFALVNLLDLRAMIAARKSGEEPPPPRLVFGLVSVEDKAVRLRRIYDAIPDDLRLAQDIRLALADSLPTYVARDPGTRKVTIFVPSSGDLDEGPAVELKGGCDGPGSPAAQVVLSARSFYSAGVTLPAIAVAGVAIDEDTWPRKLIAADPAPCARAAFKSKGVAYELRGTDGSSPVRYAVAQDAEADVAYLLRGPSLDDGIVWLAMDRKARKRFEPTGAAYLLATEGADGKAAVFRYYDAVPDDERLARDMSAALSGAVRPMFVRYLGGDQVGIVEQVEDTPKTPGGGDSSQVSQSEAPDGDIFLASDGGAAVHAATRFACPEAIEGYSRTLLMIFDPADGGRDVACRYMTPEGWFTLYLTRVEPGMDAAEVFQTYVLQAKTVAPPSGELAAPVAPGGPDGPQHAAFWIDEAGMAQGLWVSRYGDWYVKQRATYAPTHGEAMGKAAEAVFRRAAEAFKIPEPAPAQPATGRTSTTL